MDWLELLCTAVTSPPPIESIYSACMLHEHSLGTPHIYGRLRKSVLAQPHTDKVERSASIADRVIKKVLNHFAPLVPRIALVDVKVRPFSRSVESAMVGCVEVSIDKRLESL